VLRSNVVANSKLGPRIDTRPQLADASRSTIIPKHRSKPLLGVANARYRRLRMLARACICGRDAPVVCYGRRAMKRPTITSLARGELQIRTLTHVRTSGGVWCHVNRNDDDDNQKTPRVVARQPTRAPSLARPPWTECRRTEMTHRAVAPPSGAPSVNPSIASRRKRQHAGPGCSPSALSRCK
jgi:hypothetical protein